jgi:hypothetical protein
MHMAEKTMANDLKKAKAEVAPKKADPAPKKADPAPKKDAPATASGEDVSKTANAETAAAPSDYSRGEGQKAVTDAYRENWNAIFAKKSTEKKKR